MVHVGVLGAGAIGTFVGVRLLAGNFGENAVDDFKVTLVGRKSLIEAVREANNTITSKTLSGKSTVHEVGGSLVVTDDMNALREADIILVAVKSAQTAGVARALCDMLEDREKRCTIISLQNGVSNARVLRDNIHNENVHVAAGLVVFNVVWSGSTFAQTTKGEIFVQNKPQVEFFANISNNGEVSTVVEDDITPKQYGKLVLNLNNAINALSGKTMLQCVEDHDFRRVSVLACGEAMSIFDELEMSFESPSKGHNLRLMPYVFSLPNLVFRSIFPYIMKMSPSAKTSMLQDLERGRMTEIDSLNGEILHLAKTHGLPVPPVNARLVQLIKSAEGKASPNLSGADLLALVQP